LAANSLDEVQRTPEIFPVLRSIIDERRRREQFLILGSTSPGLIRRTSETRLVNQDQKKGGYCASAITPFIFPSKADGV